MTIEDIDVNLSLANGTALGGGVDFGAAGGGNLQVFNGTTWVDATTATIAAGELHIQVRTPIIDDNTDEPDETYSLTVDVLPGVTTTNIQVIGNGTIIDNDPAPNVTIGDAVATEGDQLVFAVTLSNPSSQPIVLDFAAIDNNTSGAADYANVFEFSNDGGTTWLPAASGSEVTIPANSSGVLVRVLTTEDLALETTETFDLAISSVVSGLVGDTTDTAIGTILDDDTALVSIVANDPVAGEPADDGQFTVSISNPSDSPTVIAYSVTGTADVGIDFAALTGIITLPAGATSATIDLSVIDDLVVEGDEDVTITLTSIVSGDADISIDTANDTDTAVITDDDVAQWQLTGDTTVNEGADASYQLGIIGLLQAGESASVNLAIGNNSTNSVDYGLFDDAVADAVEAYTGPGTVIRDGTTVTFTSDGTGRMDPLMIDLMAINDPLVEGPEDYTVSISGATSTTGIAIGIDMANQSVTTEIQDTIDAVGSAFDKANWSIAGATTVNESGITVYTITQDAELQADEIATVDLTLTNTDTSAGDITALNDAVMAAVATYNSSSQPGSLAWDGTTLTFTSDETGPMGDLLVQITATADGFLEGPEDYMLSLSGAASSTGATICIDPAMDSVTTTIAPDTTAAQWSIGVNNAGDEGGTVAYTVSLSESLGAGESATVDLTLNDVDTNSADYANFVDAVDAAVDDYAGPGTLTFDGTTLIFTASADGDSMADLVIDLMLTDDAIAEGTETFTVDLTNPTGPTGINVAVDMTADSVTTTINDTMGIDGDPDEVIFSIMGPATGPEGTAAQYVIGLSGALGADESVSVNVNLNDIDTTSSDYTSLSAAITAAVAADPSITFDATNGVLTYTAPSDGAMMTPILIDLGLNTDAIVEGDEDFEIELSGATSSTGVAVGIDAAKELVTTTITDATAPLQWRIVGPAFEDEGGTAQYLIQLDGALGAGETASVAVDLNDLTTNSNDYADILSAITAAVSADPNVSFDPMTGVITYTAPSDGAMLAPIVVDFGITDDTFIEGPEQFEIVLSNPDSTTGAAVILSMTENSVVTTINDTLGLGGDPDGPAEWSITGNATVAEGATATYTIGLTSSLGEGESVSVDLGLADISTNSADYADFVLAVNTAVDNYSGQGSVSFDGTTLIFEALNDGDSLSDLVLDLSAIDDVLIEGDEAFTIELSNADGTVPGSVMIDPSAQSVTTTIIDNDTLTWGITGSTSVDEGGTATYTISLDGILEAGEEASVQLGVSDVDTNSADYEDFLAAVQAAVASHPNLAFDPATGILSATGTGAAIPDLIIQLDAEDDGFIEGPENFAVMLSSPTGSTGANVDIEPASNVVNTTINDTVGDGGEIETATFSISGPSQVNEGDTASFTISLDGTFQAGEVLTVEVNLTDVDTNSSDYADVLAAINAAVAMNPDLTFDPATGLLTYTAPNDGAMMADLIVDLPTNLDTLIEGDETFSIGLENWASPTGANVQTDSSASQVNTTIVEAPITPALAIAKAVVSDPVFLFNGNYELAFRLQIDNPGSVDLIQLSLIEDLMTQLGGAFAGVSDLSLTTGPGNAASNIAVNPNWNGASITELLDPNISNNLAAGDSFVIEFNAEINPRLANGPLSNQVTGSGTAVDENGNVFTDPDGTPIVATDESDNGVDPQSENGDADNDGVFGNDPTIIGPIEIDPTGFFYVPATGEILTGGSISVQGPVPGSVILTDAGNDGSYQFFGTVPGIYTVIVTPPPGFTLLTDTLLSGAFDPTGQGSPVILGADEVGTSGVLDGTTQTQFYLQFDLEAGDPLVLNNNLPFTTAGTTGNPPRLPTLGGQSSPRLSDLLSGPIASFANSSGGFQDSLSLQSNFPSGGGYSLANGFEPCESTEPDPCECYPDHLYIEEDTSCDQIEINHDHSQQDEIIASEDSQSIEFESVDSADADSTSDTVDGETVELPVDVENENQSTAMTKQDNPFRWKDLFDWATKTRNAG